MSTPVEIPVNNPNEVNNYRNKAVWNHTAGAMTFNNSTGRFTAPVAGNYYFFASAYYHNDTNAISGYIHWLFD